MSPTLVVNIFGGPGIGKSTTAAKVFADLKTKGIETELAHEYAKDLTWEERHKAIGFQPYVTATQMWRVHRLLNKVDVVITDSPILLGLVYKGEGCTPGFTEFVKDTFDSWYTLNFVLRRHLDKNYSTRGRNQTKDEAIAFDTVIKELLLSNNIPFTEVEGPPASHSPIVDDIIEMVT